GDLWAEIDVTAPSTGTYTLLASREDAADGTGQYMVTLAQTPGTFVVPVGDEGGPLANGGNFSGALLRGDMDQWSFSANSGDALSLTASEVVANTSFVPRLRLYGPNGHKLGNTWGDLWAEIDVTAPLPGKYTLLVSREDAADGNGQYMLTLAQSPAAFVVP